MACRKIFTFFVAKNKLAPVRPGRAIRWNVKAQSEDLLRYMKSACAVKSDMVDSQPRLYTWPNYIIITTIRDVIESKTLLLPKEL